MPEIASERPKNPAAHLKKIGLVVLLAGVVIGGLIYVIWPDEAADENSLTSQYYKSQQIDVQRMYGNEGSLVLGITRSLHRASTYSIIIIVLSVLFALVCFYLASHPADE
jgi:uncharacterized membrane protein